MTHPRATRSRSALPHSPSAAAARLLGGLLLGGALVFAAGQVRAADPSSAKSPVAAAANPCDDGVCPWHGGGRKGGHHGHGMKGGWGMGLPFAGPGSERLLDDIKATDAQRKQIREITDRARADLQALQDKARDLHPGAMALWTAPQVDAAQAEKQRQQMLAHHDQVSKRAMQAMLDVAQVLTPEQRAKAAAAMKLRHERMKDRISERNERREDAVGAGDDRLRNHKLNRTMPTSPAAPASQPAPSR